MHSWQQYTDKAEIFFKNYIDLSFNEIFSDVLSFLPPPGVRCLDIGAGSGRDAAALSQYGYDVTAVEPSLGMRSLAENFHKEQPIKWVDDSLPKLNKIRNSNVKFQLILMSAVWMHLAPSARQEALHTVSSLLELHGIFIMTLRLGSAEPERFIYEVSVDEAIIKSNIAGLKVLHINPIRNDSLNRAAVKWQILVLTK